MIHPACRLGNSEKGFTIIELLTVTLLLSILIALAMSSFWVYRAQAGNAHADATLASAMSAAEASQTDPYHLPPQVAMFSQSEPGPITNAAANQYLSGLRIPTKTCIKASYNPQCTKSWCVSDFVEIAHCYANQSTQWMRFGDGFGMRLHWAGAFKGCC